jgi:spermidine synthase
VIAVRYFNSTKKFYLILVDGYDENARSGELEMLTFYQNCRVRLSTEGIMAAN